MLARMAICLAAPHPPAGDSDPASSAAFRMTTFVPAVPATIPAMSASEPIAARLPVLAAKRAAASTLGPMDPAGNS
jgi:hypothetical protein